MVKRTIIVNVFGLIGITFGFFWGVMAYLSAIDMNPQGQFTDHPEQLILAVYAWIAVTATPFLLLRHLILYKNQILFCAILFSIIVSIIISLTWFSEGLPESALIIFTMVYFPCHILSMLTAFRKKQPVEQDKN